jgi:hypothetical protein
MGVLETAANGFRVALANELLTTQTVAGKDPANATHRRAGAAVRKTMEEMGVPTPAKSIQQVRRELARQRRVEEEDRLGLWSHLGQDGPDGQDDGEGDAGDGSLS